MNIEENVYVKCGNLYEDWETNAKPRKLEKYKISIRYADMAREFIRQVESMARIEHYLDIPDFNYL